MYDEPEDSDLDFRQNYGKESVSESESIVDVGTDIITDINETETAPDSIIPDTARNAPKTWGDWNNDE